MKTKLLRVVLLLVSTVLFLLLAELVLWVVTEGMADEKDLHYRYALHYEDTAGNVYEHQGEAAQAGLVIPFDDGPRPGYRFAPDSTFYICYTGLDPEARGDEFDRPGARESLCVECRMNSLGMREREGVVGPKPPGQRRILCIGDSFTFGWGVKVTDAWPRRVERMLRKDDDGIRTVNAGAAGALYVDEYRAALEKRFHVVDPDVVLVTLCLNDLIPSTTALSFQEQPSWLIRHSRLARALLQSYAMQSSLTIDPDRDLVQYLLDFPAEHYVAIEWLDKQGIGRSDLWPGGGPQRDLVAMRNWCNERGIRFAVAIWPFFQGLGPGEHYPFTKIHTLVGAFCREQGIPFLDLLPELENKERTDRLWVSPADYHGNRRSQELAAPAIANFLQRLLTD